MRTGPTRWFFFFNDTATTEIYTLSLHDALPIWRGPHGLDIRLVLFRRGATRRRALHGAREDALAIRSEEHTSELQSQSNIVCRLLLEKKKIGARTALAGRQAPVLRRCAGAARGA